LQYIAEKEAMNVRAFAMTGGAVLAMSLFAEAAGPARGQRDDAASEKLGIKLSLQCWTFNKLTFYEAADEAMGLGIKYVEMYPGQKLRPGSDLKISLPMSDGVFSDVKRKLADAGGLKVVAFGVDNVPTDEKAARLYYEAAKKLGIEVLVTETTPTALHDQLCGEYHMKMALHNHPKTWPPDQILSACKDRGKQIGSCADTGHWMRDNLVPTDMLKKLEGRVLHSHFKDRDQLGDGHDVPWGTGQGDTKAMLKELKRQGFKGYLSLEYEHGSLPDLAISLPKCVQYFDATMTELAK
jgi:sugar phosphate isomerase/epimerase